jgi:hypothetical protein
MANGGFIYYRVVGENGALLDRILAVIDRQGNRPWDLRYRGNTSSDSTFVEGVAELPVEQGWCVTETSIPLEYLETRCVPIPENEARRLGAHVFEFLERSSDFESSTRRR